MAKSKVYSSFKGNIWSADPANIQLILNIIKHFVFYYVFLIFIVKYMDCFFGKKDIIITDAFQNILDHSNLKPSKIWVDKGSDFYNRSMEL